MPPPTDDELRQRRTRSEDSLTERKTVGDLRDALKTIVAFANSVTIGLYGVLYVGVRNDGSIEAGNDDLDKLQQKLDEKLKDVFPRIDYEARVVPEDGAAYLCVIVPGSEKRPHFSGPAFIRRGSRTVVPSEREHEALIAEHNSKTRRILQFVGRHVRVERIRRGNAAQRLGRLASQSIMEIAGCTSFTIVLKDTYGQRHPIALERINILDETEGPPNIVLELAED
jgi:hypothetical protein